MGSIYSSMNSQILEVLLKENPRLVKSQANIALDVGEYFLKENWKPDSAFQQSILTARKRCDFALNSCPSVLSYGRQSTVDITLIELPEVIWSEGIGQSLNVYMKEGSAAISTLRFYKEIAVWN